MSAILNAVGGGAGGAGAAAGLGFPPLLLSALLSFAPSLLSKLFGGGDARQKLMDEIARLQNPSHVGNLTNQFYQSAIGSPAYTQGLNTIATGANATANNVSRNLGAAGLTSSGTGAILSSLTPSLVGSQQAQLKTSAYNSAQQQAMEMIQRQIAALTGTYGQPSQNQQLFGAGLDAFGPLLTAWLKSRYPGMMTPAPAVR
jgi:hypothetical protein